MEGVEFDRVIKIRISNITGGADFGLQRDGSGSWYLVDPVAYRADMGLIEILSQVVSGQMALSAPDPLAELSLLGLDPPNAELVLTERVGDEVFEHRVLVGDSDPSGSRVYVLQNGELVLTSRALLNCLSKDFQEYRSRRISEMDSAAVIEVQRSGNIQFEEDGALLNLEFNAFREGATWRSLRPYECALDPLDLSLVAVGAARLAFDQYVEEPEVDLGAYGLERPEVRVELRASGGANEVLFLGRRSVGGAWYCRREGTPDVYRLSGRDAVMLAYPFEAMIDRRLIRVDPVEVQGVRLEGPDQNIHLVREGESWTVSDDGGDPLPAEAFVVRELLAWISEAELAPFGDLSEHLDAQGLDRRFVLELHGQELGGSFGGSLSSDSSGLIRYRRHGDELVGNLDAGLLAWLDRSASDWWSLSLSGIDELEVASLRLQFEEEVLLFERGERGRWRDGRGREVSELLPWLDPLLFLRATERVDRSSAPPLSTPIDVLFTFNDGTETGYSLGAGVGLSTDCVIGPVRAVLLRDDLYVGLLALFP